LLEGLLESPKTAPGKEQWTSAGKSGKLSGEHRPGPNRTNQMKMYFNVWQLPELSQFPKGERNQIYRKYIHPLLTRWPVMLAKFGFCFPIFLSFTWLPSALWAYVAWMAFYLVADHFFDLVAIILQRPRLKKMMEDVALEKPPGSDLATAH
jgi:hypothetical protein